MGECQCTPYNIVVVRVLVRVSLAVDIIVSLILTVRKIFCGTETGSRKKRLNTVRVILRYGENWECRLQAYVSEKKKS